MDKATRAAAEAAGYRIGDYGDFLGLSDAERQLIELRLALGRRTREFREALRLTQKQVAAAAGTTQPRVAKIEAGAAGVSLDQMFGTFFAVGGRVSDLAEPALAKRGKAPRRPAKA